MILKNFFIDIFKKKFDEKNLALFKIKNSTQKNALFFSVHLLSKTIVEDFSKISKMSRIRNKFCVVLNKN